MNIEEAKEELHNIAFRDIQTKPYDLKFTDVIKILDKIELDQPKPEVPQFVAEYLVECKEDNFTLSLAYDVNAYSEMAEWLYDTTDSKNIDLFARAWIAYPNIAVEKEKLYTVEIPNPNAKGHNKIYLCKADNTGKVYLCKGNFNPRKNKNLWLTEQEIRKDFEWAWQQGFAEEVTE